MAKDIDSNGRNGFSGWPMIIFWAGMLIFAGHACTHMVAAGDTWVAMACGRHFVNHGVDTIEPFSANSHKAGPTEAQLQKFPQWLHGTIKKIHPTGWVNQNWLTHVIFYTLAKTFGSQGDYNYNMLVYWKFAIYIIVVICVYYTGRLLDVSRPMSALSACLALFIGRSFLDVRPAGFANLAVALYLLILVLAVYRNIRYIWLLVPLVVFWCNVHGGYIYAFIMLVPFVGLHILTSLPQKRFVSIGFKGVRQIIAAGAVAFIAMIIFNPFHLTNLTHTFEISVSEHAASWRNVREWKPAFDWMDRTTTEANPVGDEEAFTVMLILSWVVMAAWLVGRFLRPSDRQLRRDLKSDVNQYHWPKIDLALITMAALTSYMAIRSRRFIPIAGIAACPVIAMLIEQFVCMVTARSRFNRHGRLVVPALPASFRTAVISIAAVCVLGFGGFWGAKFKRVYLDPWPKDDLRDSIFMRMTASHVKPFDACQFIRENKINGRMFNYWTEGGAIAFGQEPDPETGKTPLQLFMDGRAQAAYNHDKFRLWNEIKNCTTCPTFINAHLARRRLTPKDYMEIGKWIDEQMKKYNVWVVLMPRGEYRTTFVKGIKNTQNWRTAYKDNYQQMFIDISTPQGKDLIEKVLGQTAKFPTRFSKHLTLAENYLLFKDPEIVLQGYTNAVDAFNLHPSQVSMLHIAFAAQNTQMTGPARSFMDEYLKKFVKNKDAYSKQAGYIDKLIAAMIAADTVAPQKNANLIRKYAQERDTMDLRARW